MIDIANKEVESRLIELDSDKVMITHHFNRAVHPYAREALNKIMYLVILESNRLKRDIYQRGKEYEKDKAYAKNRG